MIAAYEIHISQLPAEQQLFVWGFMFLWSLGTIWAVIALMRASYEQRRVDTLTRRLDVMQKALPEPPVEEVIQHRGRYYRLDPELTLADMTTETKNS